MSQRAEQCTSEALLSFWFYKHIKRLLIDEPERRKKRHTEKRGERRKVKLKIGKIRGVEPSPDGNSFVPSLIESSKAGARLTVWKRDVALRRRR